MSIEQTSQLISLILNSVLMTLLSAALIGGAWLRQNGLCLQLQQVQRQYRRLTHQQSSARISPLKANGTKETQERNQLRANLKKVRDRRQRLIGQYRWSYTGMLLLHAVLLAFGASLLALALRSLFPIDGLISTALVLFTLGVVGLIAGASCILIDVAQGNSGGDTLSYSLAKILAQIAQESHRLSPRWQRSSQLPGQPTGQPATPFSLKPFSLPVPIPSKKLPSSLQRPDSSIN